MHSLHADPRSILRKNRLEFTRVNDTACALSREREKERRRTAGNNFPRWISELWQGNYVRGSHSWWLVAWNTSLGEVRCPGRKVDGIADNAIDVSMG